MASSAPGAGTLLSFGERIRERSAERGSASVLIRMPRYYAIGD